MTEEPGTADVPIAFRRHDATGDARDGGIARPTLEETSNGQ